MILIALNNCRLVMTRGGANLILFPCVGFAKSPLSLILRQIFHGILDFESQSRIIAFSKPFPLTPLIIFLLLLIFMSSDLKISPSN